MTYTLYAQGKHTRYYYGEDGLWYRSGVESWFPPLMVEGWKTVSKMIMELEDSAGLPVVAVPQKVDIPRSESQWYRWLSFKRPQQVAVWP